MNVKFHKNRKNTVKLKISCVRCHFVKLTFFSGSNEKRMQYALNYSGTRFLFTEN